MTKLKVIGMGPGDLSLLTQKALQALETSEVILGAPRLIQLLQKDAHENQQKLTQAILIEAPLNALERLIEQHKERESITVLASGDTGFFSIARLIRKKFEEKYDIEYLSGISSMQYFCNQLGIAYEDIHTISVHGRENTVLEALAKYDKVFLLTGGNFKVQDVCKMLCEARMGDLKVYAGENLSYKEERIVKGRANTLASYHFKDLSVMLIERERKALSSKWPYETHGIPDEAFIRGNVPMTKQEIRSVCLSKMQIKKTDVLYDLGAGTGSVAIEMALQAKEGFVYAVEKKEEAVELIYANKEKFAIENMAIIGAVCPDKLDKLPMPDKVFIGGTSGKLERIIEVLLAKNPSVKIVLTAITLETLSEALSCAKNKNLEMTCTQMAVGNSQKVGTYHMMNGQNPIFIVTMEEKLKEV